LVVELDGTSHDDKTEYDKNREDLLNSLGLKVIHYDDVKVLNNFHLIEEDFKKQMNIRV
jgi:very-short-patch-repair endonuclease